MDQAHYDDEAMPRGPSDNMATSPPGRSSRGGTAPCLGSVLFALTYAFRSSTAASTLARRIPWCPSTHSGCSHTLYYALDEHVGGWMSGLGLTAPLRLVPRDAPAVTAEEPRAPILERARKLAGLWVIDDNGQNAYLEWMDFCQDWARHRLKQFYFEKYDPDMAPPRERTNPCFTAQWTWEHDMRMPPYRTTQELDRMANDICEEAWDQGKDIRGHLVALVRSLQQRGILPTWFSRAVTG